MKKKALSEYFKIGTAAVTIMALAAAGYSLVKNDIKKDANMLTKVDYGYYDDAYEAITDQTDNYYLNDASIDYINNKNIKNGLILSDRIQSGIKVEENSKQLIEISNEIEFYALKELKEVIAETTGLDKENMEIHFSRDVEGAGEEYAYVTCDENSKNKSIRLDHELISVVEAIVHVQNTNQKIIDGSFEYTRDNYLKLAENIEKAITNTVSMRNHEYKAKEHTKYTKVKTL